jgi:hypothetical protein
MKMLQCLGLALMLAGVLISGFGAALTVTTIVGTGGSRILRHPGEQPLWHGDWP